MRMVFFYIHPINYSLDICFTLVFRLKLMIMQYEKNDDVFFFIYLLRFVNFVIRGPLFYLLFRASRKNMYTDKICDFKSVFLRVFYENPGYIRQGIIILVTIH